MNGVEAVQTTVTRDALPLGRVRQLTDTPTTDYRRAGASIPPTGGSGDDPPRERPGGDRGDDDKPSRLEAIATRILDIANALLLLAFLLLLAARWRS